MILIYVAVPSKEETRKIAKHLLDKRLIACANIFDNVNALYRWEGKLADEKECIMLAKTVENKFEAVKAEIEKIHPDKIPCILKINTEANKAFSDWVGSETAR